MHPTHNPTGPAADTDTDAPVVTPADILRGAARYLEIHGWHKGDYYARLQQPFPPACVSGAIGMAVHGRKTDCPVLCTRNAGDFHAAWQCLSDYLRLTFEIVELGESGPSCPSQWNDQDGQTAATVIATLREAADEYDWQHATEADLETYAENELDYDRIPDRAGFLAWLARRAER